MIKRFISIFNLFYLRFKSRYKDKYTGKFLFVRIDKAKKNEVNLVNVDLKHVIIKVDGSKNSIISNQNFIENSKIVIQGTNNRCILHQDVKLRKATINIRGNNNIVEIKRGTTFGGVRIVNVGENNSVNIGEDCLFSDHIEIWASDTHSIYNPKDEKINKEKPILIKDRVWVGSRVIILKGVKISEGAVVGMGTIVTKDIPQETISVGSPNKVIRNNIYWTNKY